MSALALIPCDHINIDDCDCLNKPEKNMHLYRFHEDCMLKSHNHFEESGYYIVEKPTWRYSCDAPFEQDDPFHAKLEEFYILCNLKCLCTSTKICPLCTTMLEIEETDSKCSDTFFKLWNISFKKTINSTTFDASRCVFAVINFVWPAKYIIILNPNCVKTVYAQLICI